MRPSSKRLGRFFLHSLLLLGPALALWYWAHELLIMPVAWIAEQSMRLVFSAWVHGAELEGTTQTLLTSIPVPQASGRLAQLTPEAHLLNYCFGTPLLAALLVASRTPGLAWKLPLGLVLLLPFQAWGVFFAWVVGVGFHAREYSQAVTGFSLMQLNMFGLAYQVGTLLMPTLVPVLLWLQLDRGVIPRLLIEPKSTEVAS